MLPKVLAGFLELLTGKPRYFPTITWSATSWTHNLFRLYELIFGREYGIRPEMTSWVERDADGNEYSGYAFHSLESLIAHTEGMIRKGFKLPKLVKVHAPVLAFAGSPFQNVQSPYMFAIAFDAASSGDNSPTYGTTTTVSHTCTGSDLLLWSFSGVMQGDSGTGVTYNGVSETFAIKKQYTAATETGYAWYLPAPDTGTNDAVFTSSVASRECFLNNQSYSGCAQTGIPDATATQETNGTSLSQSITTVADNCWAAVGSYGQRNTTASTGVTARSGSGTQGFAGDSNGAITPAGSYTMTCTISAGLRQVGVYVSFKPAGGGGGGPRLLGLLGVGT